MNDAAPNRKSRPDVSRAEAPAPTRYVLYRHSAVVRITHWLNVFILTFLLLSGLQIFNAHPALYWGEISDFDRPILRMYAERDAEGRALGLTQVLGRSFETTGVLGLSEIDGRPTPRGFPAWATIPSHQDLATGRVWHFFFAWALVINGAIYLVYSLVTRHFWRDLLPSGKQLRGIGRSIGNHLRLRFHDDDDAVGYNVMQKLIDLVVILILLPLVVLTGLTMSPAVNAGFPELLTLFSGRQSARTLHFVAAWLLVLFTLVHLLALVLSGPWNGLRSMVTGRYVLRVSESRR